MKITKLITTVALLSQIQVQKTEETEEIEKSKEIKTSTEHSFNFPTTEYFTKRIENWASGTNLEIRSQKRLGKMKDGSPRKYTPKKEARMIHDKAKRKKPKNSYCR
ncbi:MAG: hypothetical protein ABW168_15175 [Sedimenticola sp.]